MGGVRRQMKIIPAILAETWDDFLVRMRQAEVFTDYVQIDLMDGKFVPAASFPPEMLSRVVTRLRFEIHLMVDDPIGYLAQIRNPALEKVIFHIEAATDPLDAISHIAERGLKAALAFRPETEFSDMTGIAEQAGDLLFLTVDPGRYGSPFRPEVLKKIQDARKTFPDKTISVDGGVSLDNLERLWHAGADCGVVGGRIFLKGEPCANYRLFVEAAERLKAGTPP